MVVIACGDMGLGNFIQFGSALKLLSERGFYVILVTSHKSNHRYFELLGINGFSILGDRDASLMGVLRMVFELRQYSADFCLIPFSAEGYLRWITLFANIKILVFGEFWVSRGRRLACSLLARFREIKVISHDRGRHEMVMYRELIEFGMGVRGFGPLTLCRPNLINLRLGPHYPKKVSNKLVAIIADARSGSLPSCKSLPLSLIVELSSKFLKSGISVVLLGSSKNTYVDFENIDTFGRDESFMNLCGQTSLDQYIWWANEADLVVSPDSSAAHLRSTFGKPLLCLYGPTNPLRTLPDGNHVYVLFSGVSSDGKLDFDYASEDEMCEVYGRDYPKSGFSYEKIFKVCERLVGTR